MHVLADTRRKLELKRIRNGSGRAGVCDAHREDAPAHDCHVAQPQLREGLTPPLFLQSRGDRPAESRESVGSNRYCAMRRYGNRLNLVSMARLPGYSNKMWLVVILSVS